MLGVGAVQVPALVALFLAFGACVMQVGGGEGGGGRGRCLLPVLKT